MDTQGSARRFAKLEDGASYLDAPAAGVRAYGESVSVSGWLYARGRAAQRCRIRAWIAGELAGETRILFSRPDVSKALAIADAIPTGFRFLAGLPNAGDASREAEVCVTAAWEDGSVEYEFARTHVQLVPAQLATRPHGTVVGPDQRTVLQRESIYGSGPPASEPGPETLYLIQQYLTPASSVADIGCGAGAYGPALIQAGHDWIGFEVNAGCLEMLQDRRLSHRRVDANAESIPAGDGEFDHVICIEVLEHIENSSRFLAEVARVTRKRALFSVPNIEVLPYFSAWQVVPWHLLEADHKNFFTRASLLELLRAHFANVEVFSYAEHPLRTPDGIALHLHLFAIADK